MLLIKKVCIFVKSLIKKIETKGLNKKEIELLVNRVIVYDANDDTKSAGIADIPEGDGNGYIVIEYNYSNWRNMETM